MGSFVGQHEGLAGHLSQVFEATLSSTGAAPDVAPLSKMPVFRAHLFSTLRSQCAATLLPGRVSVKTDITFDVGVVVLDSISSCSLTRQVSGDQ